MRILISQLLIATQSVAQSKMVPRLRHAVNANVDVVARELIRVFEDMAVNDPEFAQIVELSIFNKSVYCRLDIITSDDDVNLKTYQP